MILLGDVKTLKHALLISSVKLWVHGFSGILLRLLGPFCALNQSKTKWYMGNTKSHTHRYLAQARAQPLTN